MVTIHRSRAIAAPADRVWALMRDFGGPDRWAPGVLGAVELRGDAETVGSERLFLAEGEVVNIERLYELDDEARVTRYGIVDGRLPMLAHVATLRVSEAGAGAVAEWIAEFETDEAIAGPLTVQLEQIYDAALEQLALQTEG